MGLSCRAFVCLLGLLFITVFASAQVQTGTPPFGSYTTGPDTINLANLNVNVLIPIRHKAGRGIDFDYTLAYDSSVWQRMPWGTTAKWVPASQQWGWRGLTKAGQSYLTYSVVNSQNTCYNGGPVPYSEWDYSNFVYYDQTGNVHYFADYPQYFQSPGGSNCPPNGPNPSTPQPSYDGSGLTLYVTPGPGTVSAYIVDKNGTIINPPISTSPPTQGSTVIEDRNGNEITSSNGAYTDTLNTNALNVITAPPSTVTLSYPAPSGATASYTVTYVGYIVRTNFGCSNIVEYNSSPNLVYLVDKVTLPDSSFYQFAYEPTPGFASDVTGRVASIRLRTGDTIFYQYSGGANGITCADGSAATLQRKTMDGTWKYVHSESGTAWTTNVTDPQNNATVLQFQDTWEILRQVYQGSVAPANLLQTVTTCYNGVCPMTSPPSYAISQRKVTIQLGNGGPQCMRVYFYQPNPGLLTEQDDYDYATGTPTVVLRKNIITYASLGPNISNMPASVKVTDGAGSTVSQTINHYDGTAVVPTSGTPQHVTVSGPRGNLTSVDTYTKATTFLTNRRTYFDTGAVQTSTNVNGAVTTSAYGTGSCGNSFPTSLSEPLSMSGSFVWNCTGGVLTQVTDENSKSTSVTYNDSYFWRPANIVYPDGGQTSWTYNSPNGLTTTHKMNSSQNIVTYQLTDGLGRTSQTQLTSDPLGIVSNYTNYDSLGRVASVYNPTRCSPPYTNCGEATWGYTGYSYDSLNRTTSVRSQDGTSVTATFLNNTATVTDQAGRSRKLQIDALGRQISVWEDPNGVNYETDYTYDPQGNPLTVNQKGGSTNSANWRTRTFTYDFLSRQLTDNSPESGLITYVYDTNGNLATRTDARTITTTYSYDLLHRNTKKTYSDGTPTANFYYDTAPSFWAGGEQNTVGRLVEATTSNTATEFSYDPMGRVSQRVVCTPMNCTVGANGQTGQGWSYYYTYNQGGNLTQFNDGIYTWPQYFNQTYDGSGRVTTVTSTFSDAQHPATFFTADASLGYFPNGSLRKATLGNGLAMSNVYYNTLRPCLIDVNSSNITLQTCSDSTPVGNVLDLAMNYYGNGNISGWNATGNQSFVRTYNYDSLNRVSSMADTVAAQLCKGLSWNYDPWGNRTDQNVTAGTCGTFHATITAQNRLSGAPYVYDSAGNMTHDSSHSYTYDAEGRLSQVDGGATASYVYDALGLRAKKTVGANSYEYVYDINGQIGWELLNTHINRSYIRSNGTLLAEYYEGTTYFAHQDHLGSTRLLTRLDKSIRECDDYYPYGETNTCGDITAATLKFTGDERDNETGLDNTEFRKYSSSLGRWMTPDPAGLGAADPTNPQSWNRYSYVMNNPLNLTDPTGLYCQWDDGTTDDPGDTAAFTPSECQDQGGTWISVVTSLDYGPNGQIFTCYDDGSCKVSASPQTDPTLSASNLGGNISVWDFFKVPWSGSVIVPLVPFGPAASAGAGPTFAYNPMTDTGCAGLAAGAMVPAGGRAAAAGPLTVGNLGNADQILAGGSVFAGAQSPNPAMGVQVLGNSSGLLAGPTFGTPGIVAGASFSGCKSGIGKKLLNWLIDSIL